MTAETDFQLTQMLEMLKTKMIKRNIDIKCLDVKELYPSGKQVKQEIIVRQGLEKEQAKKISKMVKDAKLNVQPAIQGNQVRITGKKRDDLQAAIALLRKADLDMPLQYSNFRD